MNASSPLIISVVELAQGPMETVLDEAPGNLDLNVEGVEFLGHVAGRLSWRWIDDRAVAHGRVSVRARMTCARCLADVLAEVAAEVRLAYTDEPVADEEVVVIGQDDEGLSHYTGGMIDAREDIREILLVEIPDVPLCSQDCKGLCPQCGADLNQGPCDCPAKAETRELNGGPPDWKKQIERLRGQFC